MGEILFLSHRIPFPPDRGDKIRSHNVLKGLARLAPVHVATFADDANDSAFENELADCTASYRLVQRRKSLPVAGIQALLSGKALSLTAFHDAQIATYVKQVLANRPISAIYIFSGQMAQYVPADFAGRVVADLVDVDSAKFEAYAAQGGGFRSWMEKREAHLLQAEETRICGQSDATLLISKAEASLMRSRLPAQGTASIGNRVRVMGNGLDAAFFDPASVASEPRMMTHKSPRIVFTGQMDYAPNIAAVTRAIDRIMPLVRQQCPDASLHVVGRNPPPSLRAHDGKDGIYVWGRVDDIRPWLLAGDLALVPLDIARGVQNKVLEAMAMGLPVVLSPGAATGIDACNDHAFIVRESDEEMAAAILQLVKGHQSGQFAGIGKKARDWIVQNASWEAALACLPEYLGISLTTLENRVSPNLAGHQKSSR